METVALLGPVSVCIDGSLSSFHMYSSGVYYDKECSSTKITHTVVVVGYGIDPQTGESYWLIKNSWGPEWGELGYIRMARNRQNHCCIACRALYPIV